ncbi:YceD family protein [Luteolibacter pohnpeiensis]|uniref:YceD family protein n=1 Tax=Luteolibacter pohnpeiensis TaxID=454153 RepID=UPI0019046BBA|nr:hypothetical protein [Luteolibacter pohnpeiensis]
MNRRLKIELSSLPDEGKAYSGELPQEIFDLPEGDAKPLGPLEYDLWVQRFGSELLLTGTLSAPFQFTCVVTLKEFKKTIHLEDAAVSLEIESAGEVDATDALREEILINFPADPRCDEGDEPEPCEIDSRYLSVDKTPEDGLRTPPRSEGSDRWSALDSLKDLKDQP